MEKEKTYRSWTFTLWNHDDEPPMDKDKIKYAVYQLEEAADKKHWQGYFTAKNAIRRAGAKKIVGVDSVHVEPAMGSAEQNYKYCTKTGEEPEYVGKGGRVPGTDFIEIGSLNRMGQGKRNDLQDVVDKVNDGATIEEIAEDHGAAIIKFGRGIERLIDLKRTGRSADVTPEILIYWGDSGTGKTRKATEEYPDAYIISKPNSDRMVWWDGYQGEETVIVDEFYGWIPYNDILRMCDRYPLRVPYKGGFHKLKATRFIFTSNRPWTDWYPNVDDPSKALERRIKEFGKITHFRKLAEHDVN